MKVLSAFNNNNNDHESPYEWLKPMPDCNGISCKNAQCKSKNSTHRHVSEYVSLPVKCKNEYISPMIMLICSNYSPVLHSYS